MSSQIACRNVVKVKFDKKSDSNTTESKESDKTASTTPKSTPMLHPSLSLDNLLLSANHEAGNKPETCASPLRSSTSKPPREKQLHSIKLLVEQHNNEFDATPQDFVFLIDAEWMNAWYRFTISSDHGLYPGAITNWSLIAPLEDQDTFTDAPALPPISALTAGSSAASLSSSNIANSAAAAISHRRTQMRGLSFDGEECDFADELEQFQQKTQQLQAAQSPVKQSVSGSAEANVVDGEHSTTHPIDYDYLTAQFRLRRCLRTDIDYYILPYPAWQALHGWYGGGPPLPRALLQTLRTRPVVHCAVGHVLLQLPANPNVELMVAQACEGFDEGAALHNEDLYPPEESVPCVQDVVKYYATANTTYTLPASPYIRNNNEASFASFDTSMSTLSLPSMADLTVISAVPSTTSTTPNTTTTPSTTNNTTATDITTSNTTTTTTKKKLHTSCHVCKRAAVTRCSKCGSIFYCGRECQLLHWKYHKTMCTKICKKRLLQSLEIQKEKDSSKSNGGAANTTSNTTDPTANTTTTATNTNATLHPEVTHDRAGKVGLTNLGNSCYMNSSLQCISHIKPLTLAFLSRRIMSDLNTESRDGSGGKLVEQYAKLLDELWFETKKSVSPHMFKSVLGRINSEYAGLAQQDAHELIELLLDKLHEDLNRVLKKPYTEKVEFDGTTSESIVAQQSWETHGLRENSFIRDLMGSMMRYQLTCPDCHKVSLSFEYHTTLQVAIPRRNSISRRVVFVPQIVSLKDVAHLVGSVSTSSTSNTNTKSSNGTKGKPMSVFDAVLQYTTPQVYEITLDRLCTVRSLRDAVRKKIHVTHPLLPGQEILLVESAHPNCSAVTRILRDALAVAKLNEEAVVFAYCPPDPELCPHQTIVFQRAFDPLTADLPSPSTTATSITTNTTNTTAALDWKSLLSTSLWGVPLLVSYHSDWHCTRLRYQVLLNSLRLFHPDSPFLHRARLAIDGTNSTTSGSGGSGSGGSLVEQFKLSNELELRLTDPHGTSTTTALTTTSRDVSLQTQMERIWSGAAALHSTNTNTNTNAALQQAWIKACMELSSNSSGDNNDSSSGSRDVEILFGSLLPIDKSATVEEFGGVATSSGPNTILFLSLDITGDKRAMFNHAQIQQLYPTTTHTATTNTSSTATTPKPSNNITLYQCLQEHTKQEVLETGNEVYCSNCKEHKCLTKEVKFCRAHLPRVLVLSLKRFEFRDVSGVAGMYGGSHREKIDTFVDFPVDGLDLAPFCQQSVAGETSGGSDSTVYDLFAVCNHYGRMGFGHYTAAARDWTTTTADTTSDSATSNTTNTSNITGLSKQWYVYDDNDVTGPCTPEEVETEVHSRNAYILFYKQRGSPATFD